MFTAELMTLDDRCRRLGYWSQFWELNRLRPMDVLRRAVDCGLASTSQDPGVDSGDEVMTLCSMRQIDTKQNQLYDLGVHLASLADIVVAYARASQSPWERPEDIQIGFHRWESGAFINESGTKLRRLIICDRLSSERHKSEMHSWRNFGEVVAYGMPMVLTVVIVGQQRDGRHTAPWSRGYLHPVGNQNLRFKKRDGSGLEGKGWKQLFREQCDHLTREYWLERMAADGVLQDLVAEIEIPVPLPEVVTKVRSLVQKKLDRIAATKETPEPQPSQCFGNVPCQFVSTCWQFRKEPVEREGYIRLR